MPELPPGRLTIEAARDGGYTVVGRDKAILYAGDLAAVTSYVSRTIRKAETPMPQVRGYTDFTGGTLHYARARPSLFA